jgi:hypothetical protein
MSTEIIINNRKYSVYFFDCVEDRSIVGESQSFFLSKGSARSVLAVIICDKCCGRVEVVVPLVKGVLPDSRVTLIGRCEHRCTCDDCACSIQ